MRRRLEQQQQQSSARHFIIIIIIIALSAAKMVVPRHFYSSVARTAPLVLRAQRVVRNDRADEKGGGGA